MAKHTGRGISAIEYPTGMNQNGDPSQAWIKIKPDGRVDVFSGTSDIGNGSKTIQSQIVAEALGVPYEWITYDNSNTDSSPVCTGTFASRATFVAGNAVLKAARQARERLLEIAAKELEIDPADLDVVDGEVVAKGAPQKKISVPDVAAAATWTYGELITGTGAQLNPYAAIVEPDTGRVDLPPHAAISYAACAAEVEVDDETGEVRVEKLWQCFDVGRAINPTLVEGQIEGGAMMGLGLAVLEECYPYYPSVEHRGAEFGSYLAPGIEGLPEVNTIIIENPSADGPYGAKGISEMANNPQPPAIAAAVYDAVGVWVTELPITPERLLRALQAQREPRREGKAVIFDEHLSVNSISAEGSPLPLRDPRLARERQRLVVRHVERRAVARVRARREHPRGRRRAGADLPRELRPRLRRRDALARAHGAGHGRDRGRARADGRRAGHAHARRGRLGRDQPRRRALRTHGERRAVHRGARARPARPRPEPRPRPRPRPGRRRRTRRALTCQGDRPPAVAGTDGRGSQTLT